MLSINNDSIWKSIASCIPIFAKEFKKEALEFKATFKTHLLTKEDTNANRGAAFAIAGIIKGLGIGSLTQEGDDLLKDVNDVCFNKKTSKPANKIAGLYLYETLSVALGKTFELYL